jgi:Tfp pilus assembly protein PilO
VPVNIEVTGSFSSLMNYLADIESLNYFMNITSLSFKKASAASDSTARSDDIIQSEKITMSLSGYSYWR